jgi:arylsulfatase A-like enzyme
MKRRLVAYALNILDTAVGSIVNALERTGMMDNTYVIFASDNGGCYAAGGKNGPLRGTKGTVLEGGTKVDAFVYSPLLSASAAGTLYNNLFHVSDWFPTLLDLAGIEYTPREGYELDGVSHAEAFADPASSTAVRTHMLYNSYYNVDTMNLDMWSNGPFAVRNEQYKLIHFFNSSTHAAWYQSEEILDDDTMLEISTQCTATAGEALTGEYVYGLYDLINDPYEQHNLYNENTAEINAVKEELYAQLQLHHAKAKPSLKPGIKSSEIASVAWKEAGGFISPFVKAEDATSSKGLKGATSFDATKTFPNFCPVSTDMAYSLPL